MLSLLKKMNGFLRKKKLNSKPNQKSQYQGKKTETTTET